MNSFLSHYETSVLRACSHHSSSVEIVSKHAILSTLQTCANKSTFSHTYKSLRRIKQATHGDVYLFHLPTLLTRSDKQCFCSSPCSRRCGTTRSDSLLANEALPMRVSRIQKMEVRHRMWFLTYPGKRVSSRPVPTRKLRPRRPNRHPPHYFCVLAQTRPSNTSSTLSVTRSDVYSVIFLPPLR